MMRIRFSALEFWGVNTDSVSIRQLPPLRRVTSDRIAGLAGNQFIYCRCARRMYGTSDQRYRAHCNSNSFDSMEIISKFQQRSPSQIAAFTSDSMNSAIFSKRCAVRVRPPFSLELFVLAAMCVNICWQILQQ